MKQSMTSWHQNMTERLIGHWLNLIKELAKKKPSKKTGNGIGSVYVSSFIDTGRTYFSGIHEYHLHLTLWTKYKKNFLFPTTMMCTFLLTRMLTTFSDFKRNFDQKRTKQHHSPNCCSPFFCLLSNYNGLFCQTLFFIFKLTRKRSATILISLGLIMIYDRTTFTAQNSVHSAHSPMA